MKQSFSKILDLSFDSLDTIGKYNFFLNVITEAISNCTPYPKTANVRQHRNPVPWWNDECTKLIRLRKATLEKWRYSRNIAHCIEYKKCVASAKKYIKKCKVDSFRKFAESINFEIDVTYVWKKCRILKNKWANVKFNEGYSDRLNVIEDTVNNLVLLESPLNYLSFRGCSGVRCRSVRINNSVWYINYFIT